VLPLLRGAISLAIALIHHFCLATIPTDFQGIREAFMGAFTKRWIIQKRRARREKLDKLRKRYGEARSEADRASIVAKARRVSPQMAEEEFLAPIRARTAAGRS
jgi:hypothetical protein